MSDGQSLGSTEAIPILVAMHNLGKPYMTCAGVLEERSPELVWLIKFMTHGPCRWLGSLFAKFCCLDFSS